jgi:hypothetical protein
LELPKKEGYEIITIEIRGGEEEEGTFEGNV